MAGYRGTKLNLLLKAWPPGTVAASSWLEIQGIYHQLAAEYEQSAWIKRIGHGAFIRDGDQVGWEGGLYAIQNQLNLPIHVAAKTALEFQGASHFAPSNHQRIIQLFGAPRARLPRWFRQHNWNVRIHFTAAHLFTGKADLGVIEKQIGAFSIRASSRERAIIELLDLIPQDQAYDEAKLIFEGLRTLRPDLLQRLLEKCRSIKAKRLFLHLADATHQPWLKDLRLARVSLGNGKRVIGAGGSFDPKYKISVPRLSKDTSSEDLEGP